jgi:hypothetical protein
VMARMSDLGLGRLPVRALFDAPTVAALSKAAADVALTTAEQIPALVRRPRSVTTF